MAERVGLLDRANATLLSKTLLAHGADLSAVYRGYFRPFFDEPRIKTILEQREDLEHLSSTGLAVGGAWVDRFIESCPLPLIPERHLEGQAFHNVAPTEDIAFYAETPWLAWVEVLDLISAGPWVGLQAEEIVVILESLRLLAVQNKQVYADIRNRALGERIAIPFFSNGLQGVVFGFFHSVDQSQKELMYTTLVQFGQTLADAYASARMQRLAEALKDDLHLDGMAREILHVVSPVKKLILSRERGRVGYMLLKEHNYWAGYKRLAAANDFVRDPSSMGFTVDGPHGVAIYIEPLTDVPNFHHQFTHIRVEMCLRRCFGNAPGARKADALSNGQLNHLHSELSAVVAENGASLAKLRQYYITTRVHASWEAGRVSISNFEMKQFLERKLKKKIKNGYQITSYVSEIEKLLNHKVEIRKTRNALSISWNPSA